MNRRVRKRRCAVAAYASSHQRMYAEIDEVRYREAGIGKESSACLRVIRRAGCTRCRHSSYAGIVTVAEEAGESADLIVADLRIKRRLHDHIRSNVVRVVRGRVIEAAARTRIAEEEVLVRIRRREDILRILQRYRHRCHAELLLNPHARLARPAKTNVVLSVDRHRQNFRTVVRALLRLCHQRPHLAASYGEAALRRSLSPDLPLPQRIAVALVVVAGYARREKISLKVARQLERSSVTLEQPTQPALATGEVELAGMRLRRSRIGSGVERRIHIRIQRPLPIDRLQPRRTQPE